jgi:hypothetical protein
MSELLVKQIAFQRCVWRLQQFAEERGYALTFGDAWDQDKDGGHMRKSAHYSRLAIDFNLFVKDEEGEWTWVRGSSEAWQALGMFWKTLHPEARFGGDFKSRDYGHFSFEDGGIR